MTVAPPSFATVQEALIAFDQATSTDEALIALREAIALLRISSQAQTRLIAHLLSTQQAAEQKGGA